MIFDFGETNFRSIFMFDSTRIGLMAANKVAPKERSRRKLGKVGLETMRRTVCSLTRLAGLASESHIRRIDGTRLMLLANRKTRRMI